MREAYTDEEALLWLAAFVDADQYKTAQQLAQAVAMLLPADAAAVIAFVKRRPKGLKLM